MHVSHKKIIMLATGPIKVDFGHKCDIRMGPKQPVVLKFFRGVNMYSVVMNIMNGRFQISIEDHKRGIECWRC